jgi:hypothetical protein
METRRRRLNGFGGRIENDLLNTYGGKELGQLNSFLVDRKKLPVLEKEVSERLGYNF